MVRRVRKKAFFEPGDTGQQWNGEAAASFVCIGIASSRALPTSNAGYWFPINLGTASLCIASASEAKISFGGDFLCGDLSAMVASYPLRRGILKFNNYRLFTLHLRYPSPYLWREQGSLDP